MTQKFDMAVVGGGLAGMAAAVTAARTGRSVAHLAPPPRWIGVRLP